MLDHGFDAVARESTLFVIEQSIDAILEGREIGVSREEYQRSVAPPARARRSEPAERAERPRAQRRTAGGERDSAAAGGRLRRRGAGVRRLPARGEGSGRGAARPRPDLRRGARRRARFDRRRRCEADLWTSGVSLAGAARLLTLANLSISAGLGAGLDFNRVTPKVTAPDLQAEAAFWAPSPLLRTFVEIERLFGNISVSVAVGAEALLLAERYTVRTADSARDIFVPRRASTGSRATGRRGVLMPLRAHRQAS